MHRLRLRRPLDPLLLLSVLACAAAVFLLVYGKWGWGVSLLLVSALVLLLRADLGQAEEKLTVAGVSSRLALLGRVMALRSRGELALFAARREFAELEAERARLFRELGQAVFEEDESGTKAARQALGAVIQRLGEKETEITALVRATAERIQHAQGEAGAVAKENGRDDGRSA